jgi:hypothetical protein
VVARLEVPTGSGNPIGAAVYASVAVGSTATLGEPIGRFARDAAQPASFFESVARRRSK